MPIRQRGSRRTSNVHSPKRCYEASTRTPRALNDSLHPKFPARNNHSAVAVGDTVYVIAGEWRSAVRGDVWTSGDKGAAWTQVPVSAEFPARQNHASAVRGGALGGRCTAGAVPGRPGCRRTWVCVRRDGAGRGLERGAFGGHYKKARLNSR